MVVDVRTHLDLLDLLRLLRLAGEVGLFLGLIFVFADVEELADRRIGIGRDLDEVEADFGGLLDRFGGEQDAQILAILIDHAHLGHGDEFVEAGAVQRRRRRAPDQRGTYSWFLLKPMTCSALT